MLPLRPTKAPPALPAAVRYDPMAEQFVVPYQTRRRRVSFIVELVAVAVALLLTALFAALLWGAR
jgi:hypothetical protein